jgi:hypothetical protein
LGGRPPLASPPKLGLFFTATMDYDVLNPRGTAA